MSKLDESLKSFHVGEVNKLLENPEGLITDNTLNIAVLSGHHPFVSRLLKLGAQPNDDTILCALFSGQPHFIVTELLDKGAEVIKAKEHVEYSSMHHPVRSRIKGERVNNLLIEAQNALKYAETNLFGLSEKYGPFNGQKREMEMEMKMKMEKRVIEKKAMEERNGAGFFDSKGDSGIDQNYQQAEQDNTFKGK